MGATNSFIGANFILGQANLVNPNYTIQRWHTVLVAYAITLTATFINMVCATLVDAFSLVHQHDCTLGPGLFSVT
jgi:choline transport protein